MKSLVMILMLAAPTMSAHVPKERGLSVPIIDPLATLPLVLAKLLALLGPIAASLLNIATSLGTSILHSLLGVSLDVIQGLLGLVLGIVSELVQCVPAALNIPVGNIVEPILGAVTAAVSTRAVVINHDVQLSFAWAPFLPYLTGRKKLVEIP